LVTMDKFIFSIDFIVLDMEEDGQIPLILRWHFLATKRMLIESNLEKLFWGFIMSMLIST
jgi:hypothetical protein